MGNNILLKAQEGGWGGGLEEASLFGLNEDMLLNAEYEV